MENQSMSQFNVPLSERALTSCHATVRPSQSLHAGRLIALVLLTSGCASLKGTICEDLSDDECLDVLAVDEVDGGDWTSVEARESDGSVAEDGWHHDHHTYNTDSDTDLSVNYPISDFESTVADWSCKTEWRHSDALTQGDAIKALSATDDQYGLPGIRLNDMWVEYTGTLPKAPAALATAPRNLRVEVTDMCSSVATAEDVPVTLRSAVEWVAQVPVSTTTAPYDSPVGPSLCPWTDDFKVTVYAGQPDLYDSPTVTAYEQGHTVVGSDADGTDTLELAMADEVCGAYQTTWTSAVDGNAASPGNTTWTADVTIDDHDPISFDIEDTLIYPAEEVDFRHGGPTITFDCADLVAPEEKDRCTLPEGGTHEDPAWYESILKGMGGPILSGLIAGGAGASGTTAILLNEESIELDCEPLPYTRYEQMSDTPACEPGEGKFAWVGPVLTHKGQVFMAAPLSVSSGVFGLGARWTDDETLANGDWRSADEIAELDELTFARSWSCEDNVVSVPYPSEITRIWEIGELPLDLAGAALLIESEEGKQRVVQVLVPGFQYGSVTMPVVDGRFRYLDFIVEIGEETLSISKNDRMVYSLPIKER